MLIGCCNNDFNIQKEKSREQELTGIGLGAGAGRVEMTGGQHDRLGPFVCHWVT